MQQKSHRGHTHQVWVKEAKNYTTAQKKETPAGKGRKRSQGMISPPCAVSLGKGFVHRRKRCRRREGHSTQGGGQQPQLRGAQDPTTAALTLPITGAQCCRGKQVPFALTSPPLPLKNTVQGRRYFISTRPLRKSLGALTYKIFITA